MSPFWEMVQAAVTNAAADIAFGTIVLLAFALIIVCLLFFLLAVRGAWRWLTRGSWNSVIRSAERKALHR